MIEFDKQLGEFLRLEGGTPEVTASAKWTVKAIPLTGRGKQRLEQKDLLAVRHLRRVDESGAFFFRREAHWPGWAAMRIFGVFQLHLARQVGKGIKNVHALIIELMF